MIASPAIDLDDVTGCPVADSCEGCETSTGLSVATLETPIGIYCVTLCHPCAAADRPGPAFGWTDTAVRVCEHSHHLGIDLDQMADALDAEREAAESELGPLLSFGDVGSRGAR